MSYHRWTKIRYHSRLITTGCLAYRLLVCCEATSNHIGDWMSGAEVLFLELKLRRRYSTGNRKWGYLCKQHGKCAFDPHKKFSDRCCQPVELGVSAPPHQYWQPPRRILSQLYGMALEAERTKLCGCLTPRLSSGRRPNYWK